MLARRTFAAVAILCVGTLTGCFNKVDESVATTNYYGHGEPGVFIHLTRGPEDQHRALMALQMANMMSEEERPVLVYCDIEAVKLLTENAEDFQLDPFPSLHVLLDTLIEKEVTVMACPGCLKAAGIDPEELREGIQVADKEGFFNFTDGRVLTLDY